MEVFIFGWWWTSHQSLVHKRSTYSQNLYCALERWTRTHNQTLHGKTDWRGSKVHRNTERWTELMVSQWNSSGISSQDSTLCSMSVNFKSYWWDWMKHQNFWRKDHLHVDVQWHLMGITRQQDRMRVNCPTRFSICKKIRSRTLVTSRSWFREKVVF